MVQLRVGGERDELPIDVPEPDRADRPFKRHGGDTQSHRGPVHGQHVAVGLPVAGQHQGLDLHFVAKRLGEQGADGTVDQPRGEGLLERGPTLALEEPAGEFPGCRYPLSIVTSQRKEVDSRPWRAGGRGTKDNRLSVTHQTTARR